MNIQLASVVPSIVTGFITSYFIPVPTSLGGKSDQGSGPFVDFWTSVRGTRNILKRLMNAIPSKQRVTDGVPTQLWLNGYAFVMRVPAKGAVATLMANTVNLLIARATYQSSGTAACTTVEFVTEQNGASFYGIKTVEFQPQVMAACAAACTVDEVPATVDEEALDTTKCNAMTKKGTPCRNNAGCKAHS